MIILDQAVMELANERLFFHAEQQAATLREFAFEGDETALAPDTVLADVASEELRRRLTRSRHLPAALFVEIGWEILLELFVSEHDGRRTSLSRICAASEISEATAIRYIAMMVANGLVQQCADPEDVRHKVVRLSPHGLAATRIALQEYVLARSD